MDDAQIHDRPEVKEALGLPEEGTVMGLFYVGYPEGDWPKSHRMPLNLSPMAGRGAASMKPHELKPTLKG